MRPAGAAVLPGLAALPLRIDYWRSRCRSPRSPTSGRGVRATGVERSARASLAGADFTAAMDDDLNTRRRWRRCRGVRGNTAYAEGDDDRLRGRWPRPLDVLIDLPIRPGRPGTAGSRGGGGRVAALALEQRQAARERKDYATADTIRDQLKQIGVVVEDTPRGPRWTINGR